MFIPSAPEVNFTNPLWQIANALGACRQWKSVSPRRLCPTFNLYAQYCASERSALIYVLAHKLLVNVGLIDN